MATTCLTCHNIKNCPGILVCRSVANPTKDEAARKDDTGKPRYDLIPPEALETLAVLYEMGAKKYADRNWEKGMDWSRCFAAMMRHAWAWWRGEDYDPKDGQHHMASVVWNGMSLLTWAARGKGKDDRPAGCVTRAVLENFIKGVRA